MGNDPRLRPMTDERVDVLLRALNVARRVGDLDLAHDLRRLFPEADIADAADIGDLGP